VTAVDGTTFPFALCLTHDVDRPYKTPVHALYHAVQERDPSHLRDLWGGTNPYWQFETVTTIEDDLDVRSAFYFLSEPPVGDKRWRDLLDGNALVETFGRYDVREPKLRSLIRSLADGGWEVGLHGSYHSADDRDRLRTEKRRVEEVLGDSIDGGRQHYLRGSVPETWRHYRDIGLTYDATLGSPSDHGFFYGPDVIRPFDDDFVVFPLTLMDQHLPDPAVRFEDAWAACERLLDRAERQHAVMTTLFHPRCFGDRDFPEYARLYRRLVETALDRGAWVGPPGTFKERFLETPAAQPIPVDGRE
jgi:hypothetical protein